MRFRLNKCLEVLHGKVLTNLAFGFSTDKKEAELDGERYAPLPMKIKSVFIGMSECREDYGIWIILEDGTKIFVYDNEGIGYEDEVGDADDGEPYSDNGEDEKIPTLKLKDGVKVYDHDPSKTLKDKKLIKDALMQCFINEDMISFKEILNAHFAELTNQPHVGEDDPELDADK